MHVVQVANFYGPVSGGIRTTMHQLGHGYLEHGHMSTIVVPGESDTREETPYGTIVTIAGPQLPGSGGYRVLTDVDEVCTVLDKLAPDRLEVSDRLTLRSIGWWAKACGIPAVMWAHERVDGVLDSWLRGPWPTRWMSDVWNRGTVLRFDRVACSTRFAGLEFERIGWDGVRTVPLGVDLAQFHPGRRSAELRRSLLVDGEVLLVSVSRLSREKRVDLSLDALRHLREAGVLARLVVAGAGPARGNLERAARDLPVTFIGHVRSRDDVADLLATADVALNPGPIETFCLAALESLASGTPVVASSTSAVGEVIGELGGATAAPLGFALAAGIRDVLDGDEATRRLGARSTAEKFPWSRTVDEMLAVHRELGPAA
jgi:alpha-1,6-mannosyltransferase